MPTEWHNSTIYNKNIIWYFCHYLLQNITTPVCSMYGYNTTEIIQIIQI